MDLWILIATLIFLQNTVQSIRVDDSKSKFVIVANPQEHNDVSSKADLQFPTFNSNRSHPRIKNSKKHTVHSATVQNINSLGDGKIDGYTKKEGSKLISPSVEITPANSHYLGYTIDSHLLENNSFGNIAPKKDQSSSKSKFDKQPPIRHNSKKHTNVKLPDYQNQSPFHPSTEYQDLHFKSSNVENTIHRPKIPDRIKSEKPIHEFFSPDLTDLIEKAQHLDHKISTRKHRNSEDDSLGYRSHKYEIQDDLEHQPYSEGDGDYHVYHEAPEKKKKKEIHYHQHKHLHDHDHDQKHSHKHQSGHHHDHGHDHHQKHSHSHGHDQDHWHDHHEKGEHHHKSHHSHDHHGSHDHKHHQNHDHKHDSGHYHDHQDHHDHHEDHKNWHSHKHHSDHDHKHGHDHKHKSKHGHDHHHSHKHKQSHHHKHVGKH